MGWPLVGGGGGISARGVACARRRRGNKCPRGGLCAARESVRLLWVWLWAVPRRAAAAVGLRVSLRLPHRGAASVLRVLLRLTPMQRRAGCVPRRLTPTDATSARPWPVGRPLWAVGAGLGAAGVPACVAGGGAVVRIARPRGRRTNTWRHGRAASWLGAAAAVNASTRHLLSVQPGGLRVPVARFGW